MSDREYGRKPYITATPSHMDSMRTVNDREVFNNRIEAHSEFKKPYLSPSYEAMENFYYPYNPDIYDPYNPSWDNPVTDDPDGGGGTTGDCAKFNIYITENFPGTYYKLTLTPESHASNRIVLPLGGHQDFTVTGNWPNGYDWNLGSGNNYQADFLSNGKSTNTLKITTNPIYAGFRFPFKVTDKCGYSADGHIEIEGNCDDVVPMTWDYDNSAETILQSSTASVSVLNGASPFTYSLSGSGYTFVNGSTTKVSTNRSEILYADDTSCGTSAVTVTDICENSVTGYLRNISPGAGVWALIANDGLFPNDFAGVSEPDAGWDATCARYGINGELDTAPTYTFTKGRYKVSAEIGSTFSGYYDCENVDYGYDACLNYSAGGFVGTVHRTNFALMPSSSDYVAERLNACSPYVSWYYDLAWNRNNHWEGTNFVCESCGINSVAQLYEWVCP